MKPLDSDHTEDKNGETPLQIAAYGGFSLVLARWKAVESERLRDNIDII